MTLSKFMRGFIDGALSTLGVVVGATAAPAQIIIAAAVGGTLANGISNVLSAFSAEGIQKYAELRGVERAMVARRLDGTARHRQITGITFRAGLVDGGATVLGGSIPIIPYLMAPPFQAMLIAIGLVLALALLLGVYLGHISRKNMALSALKMAAFAVLVAGLVYLIQNVIVPQ